MRYATFVTLISNLVQFVVFQASRRNMESAVNKRLTRRVNSPNISTCKNSDGG